MKMKTKVDKLLVVFFICITVCAARVNCWECNEDGRKAYNSSYERRPRPSLPGEDDDMLEKEFGKYNMAALLLMNPLERG